VARLFLFIFLLPLFLNAQRRPGHAPFFKSFDAEKLSHALTDGYDDDSMKVRSIYLWMTRHVKYDVKSFQRGRPSFDKPRKILFHRKAVCLGYSILFDSLCHYAGINSEMVPGYTYQPWYEARDTFFLGSHAWNVAQVNGSWKLIDVTWASGHIKPRKQILRKILWAFFRIPYHQKFKFVRKRNDLYFETAPELFVFDHLPSTPAWQLLPCSVPVDSFQRSPTATMNFLNGEVVICAQGNDSIPAIQAEPKCRHEVIMGKQAIYFNNGNHQDISLGYWYYSGTILVQADNKKEDRLTRILLYDSTMHQLDSAAKYFKETAANAKQEQAFFLERNRRMRQQVNNENKPLIEKQNVYRNELRKERIYAKTMCGKLKRENRHLRKATRQFRKNRLRIHRPETNKPGEERVIRMLIDQVDSANILIDRNADSTRNDLFSNKEYVGFDSSIVLKKRIMVQQVSMQGGICFARKHYLINSYDTSMIYAKEIVFSCERKVDSLDKLIVHGKDWQMLKNNRAFAEKVKAMDQLLAGNAKVCKQLARMSETSFSEDSVMDAQKDRYKAWNDSLVMQNLKLMQTYRTYYNQLKSLKKLHRRAWKKYHKEIGAEISRCAITNAFFRRYYGGASDAMKHNAGRCHSKKAYCRVKRNKLIEAQKKEDRENAKKEAEAK
jgi:hypothetical protein